MSNNKTKVVMSNMQHCRTVHELKTLQILTLYCTEALTITTKYIMKKACTNVQSPASATVNDYLN